jgi:hypothetical protein
MQTIFSSRAGIQIYGQGVGCRADWPLGSVTLDADSLTLDALFRSYRLSFGDIDCIHFGWLTILIDHHASGVPSLVRIWGWRLSRRLREVIQQHQLQVRMEQ